jgi:hypothetical protein
VSDNNNKNLFICLKVNPCKASLIMIITELKRLRLYYSFRMTLIMVFYPPNTLKHNHFTINYMVRLWRSRLLSEMQQKNIIKTNPFTNNNKPILPKKTIFDW